jgi:hypothetical protein
MHTLLQFDESMTGRDGRRYTARVCAGEDDAGHWRAWLEFHDAQDGARVLRTDFETTQPNRRDTEYWATGLSRVYLEGALDRALGTPLGAAGAGATRTTPAEPRA